MPSTGDAASPRAPWVVARPGLFTVLSAANRGRVALVTAPAGSGKTVLIRSWIETAGLSGRAAWVSVDRGERDAQRFWKAVVARLRAVDAATPVVDELALTPEFDGSLLVERLVSQLATLPEPIVLVIDDLHELLSPDALAQLQQLLMHRPPLLQVVLASRHDPQLGLHRLRISDQLTELRATDLRFTVGEARELLARSGVALSEQSLALLHQRTEGWAAGLRLAALSLSRRPDPEPFVADFAGSERTVAEYLMAEVLARQPEEVRHLLVRTSILDRVNGALADALVGQTGCERILHELEADNAFVVSIDGEHAWFRYHHLFADMLRLELRRTEPQSLLPLHRAASDWFAQHGEMVDAVRHAEAAEDWPHAAQLLVDCCLRLWLNGQHVTLAGLNAALPADAPATPELALMLAYREMSLGSLEAAMACLTVAERCANDVSETRRRRFDLVLAIVRLTLARQRGDFVSALDGVRGLLGSQEPETLGDVGLSTEARAAALMNLGIVELWSYRLSDAREHLERAIELAQRIGLAYVQVGCLGHLAVLDAWRSFSAVRQRSAQAISVAEAHGLSTQPIVCVALGMAALMDVSQGQLDAARVWLERADAILRSELEPATALLLQRARGMLDFAQGQFERALDDFRSAERLQSMLVSPHSLTAQMHEWLVLTLLRLGRVPEAHAELSRLSEEVRHWGEARTAVAAVHLAEADAQAADDALDAVLDGSAPVLHTGSLIEALLVHATARDRLGDTRGAAAIVERALGLAEADRQMFPFVLIRPIELLQRHPRHETAHAALLSDILDVLAGVAVHSHGIEPVLQFEEKLSDSELRVLGYLPSNLSAPEIAAQLYLSTSTVKTHMRQIYSKLDVHKRTEAVERARALGLLGPSAHARSASR
jgi:LuxR family transcriptional regulator, maltose regulon positive regulatory protein